MKRLVQILGDEIEELYYFPSYIKNEEIEKLWKDFRYWLENDANDHYSFDEYLDNLPTPIQIERVFVDEIYVD